MYVCSEKLHRVGVLAFGSSCIHNADDLMPRHHGVVRTLHLMNNLANLVVHVRNAVSLSLSVFRLLGEHALHAFERSVCSAADVHAQTHLPVVVDLQIRERNTRADGASSVAITYHCSSACTPVRTSFHGSGKNMVAAPQKQQSMGVRGK